MESLANLLDQKFPQFNTVTPEHALKDALHQMCFEKLDYLVVLSGADFVGILSENDVTQKLFPNSQPLESLKVKDIMNRSIPVGNSNDSIDYAMHLLYQYRSRYIAVFDEFEFKGIISENDLLKKAIEMNSMYLESTAPHKETYHWSY